MEALTVKYREYKAVKPGSYRAKIKAVEQKPSDLRGASFFVRPLIL
jgi:hypothetical protein